MEPAEYWWGWINAASAAVQAFAVVGTAGFGIYTLDHWRRQRRAEQNAELAEELEIALTRLDKAAARIRNPMGYGGEGESRKRGDRETPEETRRLDTAYTHLERIQNEKDDLKKIDDLEILSNVRFKRAIAAELEDLRTHFNKLVGAARVKMFEANRRTQPGHIDEELASQRHRENEEILWNTSSTSTGPDAYQAELNRLIDSIRRKLEPFRL